LEVSVRAKRIFNLHKVLEEARAGRLVGAELRRAIKIAQEFGKQEIAEQLKLYVVPSVSFAGDAAPQEVRDRVAKGVSALKAMGEPLSRTTPMLRKYGVVGTLNRIAKNPAASKNFNKLRAAGLESFTAEAMVLDYPHLFDPKAVAVARKRLAR
jgi:hypothetical protein